MKQSKNSFSVQFQIRWQKVGKTSWLYWRLVTTVLVLLLRLAAEFIGK